MARNFNVPFVYGNIDLHNFKPHRKNPHIANVFSQTIMVEELGSGTKRIFKYTPGKTYKLNADDMSAMQDIAAECLQMDRGRSKTETGAVHLERADFIISKQKREAEEAVRRQKVAENKQVMAEKRAELADRQRALAESNLNAVQSETSKLNVAIATKRQTANDLDTLIAEKRSKAMGSSESVAVEDLKERLHWRNNLMDNLGIFFYAAMELFRKAVDVIIGFAKSPFSVLDGDQAKTIKDTLDILCADTKDRISMANFLFLTAARRTALTNEQFSKIQREVTDVANGHYDAMINRTSIHR